MGTTIWQRIGVWLLGRIKFEQRLDQHYNIERFYLAKCTKHSYFVDTLYGFPGKEYMNCPECHETTTV